MDSDEGEDSTPLTLHKYLYASDDPVNIVDPTGEFGLDERSAAIGVGLVLDALSTIQNPLKVKIGVKVLLSGGALSRYLKLREQAVSNVFNCNCADFLTSHGIAPVSLSCALANQVAYDGLKSTITRFDAGIYPNVISQERAALFRDSQESVQKQFQRDATIVAEAQSGGPGPHVDAYFRPGSFDKISIVHEAVHNLTGLDDDDLAKQFGWNGNGSPSVFVTESLRNNRCDKNGCRRKKTK